ncbi:head completion/stabilization protein [Silvimonas sp.]|uniref:head completion/stabilization protein n=1 Tax=Silvimonas sp. TaxID=2650811 RepID=UPI00283ACCFA|nr:head completion/stabilization protein [Silvimonas sp.]MDR3429028.1 head completion/stabilization protein [Silvimonas sp.]
MNGFSATGSGECHHPGPAAHGPSDEITSHSFWPAISLNTARDVVRIGDSIPDPRLRHALIEAIASVNDELSAWRLRQISLGYPVLADVPAETVSEQSVLLQRYQRAVFATAKADLIERYADYDASGKGQKDTLELTPQIDQLRRDARFAIRAILNERHCTIELL